jgi:hypothetical protein
VFRQGKGSGAAPAAAPAAAPTQTPETSAQNTAKGAPPSNAAAPAAPAQQHVAPVQQHVAPAQQHVAPAQQHVAPAQQHVSSVQQQVSGADRAQANMKPNTASPASVPAQPPANNQYDQGLASQMSHLGLDNSNGQMQGMHKNQQKQSMPDQAVAGNAGMQPDVMGHDYSGQFSAANAPNAQQYGAQAPGQSGLSHFQYHQQAPQMSGAGPQHHGGEDLYDPAKMGQMGNYGQLDSFGGMGGADSKGYGGGGSHQYSGKGGYGKGGNVGNPQQGGAGMMQGGWQQQQQQQQNMMNQTWAPNNMYPYMNPANFNMLYMQQAGYGGMYPMGGGGFQNMPNAQTGLGGNTGGGGGGGGGQGGGGGGGGGKGMHQKVSCILIQSYIFSIMQNLRLPRLVKHVSFFLSASYYFLSCLLPSLLRPSHLVFLA